MCSFWYVECLARAGDLPQARFIFEKALGYANHLGFMRSSSARAASIWEIFHRRFRTSPSSAPRGTWTNGFHMQTADDCAD